MGLNGNASRDDGGARRNRTADLFNAIEALSQLSYDPESFFTGHLGCPGRVDLSVKGADITVMI